MINIESFSRQLGAPRALGPDDHLALAGGVRVLCDELSWTMLLDELSVDEDSMRKVFDMSRELGSVVPLTGRSGHLALKFIGSRSQDDTASALNCLRAFLAALQNEVPSASISTSAA